MFKSKVEDRYTVVAVSRNQLQDIATKYKGQKDMFYIPSNTSALKTSNIKLFPKYTGGLLGFVAFTDITDEALVSAKFVHVVKSKATKVLDITKGLTEEQKKSNWSDLFIALTSYEPVAKNDVLRLRSGFGYQLVVGIEPNKPSMCMFIDERTSPKVPVELLETVTTQEQSGVELTAEEKNLLKQYTPDLGDHTSFRVPMSNDDIEEQVNKMSDDDIAWHMLNSKDAMALGDSDAVRDRMGFREICLLELMNKNLTKKARSEVASYMLDKAGGSFVGGPTLKSYIAALAKSGQLDSNVLKNAVQDQMCDAIYYGKITNPDELRKIDVKEYGYQLEHNPHTPTDVLEKIVEQNRKDFKKSPYAGDGISSPEVKWWGSNPRMGGRAGEDWYLAFTEALNHPNYPIEKLVSIFKTYYKKYKNLEAISGMVKTLWSRPDCPREIAEQLIKEWHPKYKEEKAIPPACFSQEEFRKYWKGGKDTEGAVYNKVDTHPNTPPEILKEALKNKNTYEFSKPDIYKKLRDSGEISDKEVIDKVKKNLKLDAPDAFLKHCGLPAYLGVKGKDKLKLTPVSSEDLEKLRKEMTATTVHDDFTFEVVAAYNIDKQIHEKYPDQAKKINNVTHGLYHGTSMGNAAGILATGINTAAESRTGQMFGNGFYLASSASKAAQYASDNFSKEGLGVVFKMDVALGKKAEWKYGRPEKDDLMHNRDEELWKNAKKMAEEKGLKNYEVPRWHLTHDSIHAKKGLALQHDEFVVRDGQQINITEVIIVHKTEKN